MAGISGFIIHREGDFACRMLMKEMAWRPLNHTTPLHKAVVAKTWDKRAPSKNLGQGVAE